jgi:Rrf2 family cysteine metabolism transcriptional repressor
VLKISTKGRYATRALLEMATRYGDGPVQLKNVARTQQISLQYLQQILGPLNAAGLIHTTRGVKGGVWLAKPPAQIKLSQIVEAMEGPIAPVDCVEDPKICDRSSMCATRDVWADVQQAIYDVLEGITLEDLMKKQQKKGYPSPAC